MAVKTVNEQVTTILTIEFTSDSNSYLVNADRTPTLQILLDGVEVHSFSGTSIANTLTGTYVANWTPTSSGEYTAVWRFLVNSVNYTQAEAIFVVDSSGARLTPDDPTPDVGTENTCIVTGRFLDAGGNYKKGVLVRFSPITTQQEHTAYGYIAGDINAESDETGQISMSILRNTFGLLSITGVGIVRRVTIPDQATIDIFELAAQGNDALEVQTPEYVTLPRRSP